MTKTIFTLIYDNLARIIAGFIIFISGLLLWSCSSVKTEYYPVYKDVYVPVRCTVMKPQKPAYTGDITGNNLLIMKYAEELREALNVCTQ